MAKTNFFHLLTNSTRMVPLICLVWCGDPDKLFLTLVGHHHQYYQSRVLVTKESTRLFRPKENREVPKFLSFPHKTCPLTPFMGQTSTRPSICGRKGTRSDKKMIDLLSPYFPYLGRLKKVDSICFAVWVVQSTEKSKSNCFWGVLDFKFQYHIKHTLSIDPVQC